MNEQAAHEQEGKDATIWIDCGNVQTEDEFLSSIASQLSLAVLSLDDVVLHVKVRSAIVWTIRQSDDNS